MNPDIFLNNLFQYFVFFGARGGVVVKALRYKPAGRGFDSRWCHWNFSLTLTTIIVVLEKDGKDKLDRSCEK